MIRTKSIETLIRTLRGRKVIVERDLANRYGVATSRLH